jgi:hypothetical protein
LAIIATLGVAMAGSAEEPMITDRPDFTESSSTVGRGYFQLEGGLTFADLADDRQVTTVGEILARWGVAKKLELRFVFPTYAAIDGPGDDESGFLSTTVGLKYELGEASGSGILKGMETAIIASTTVPTGTGDFDASEWQPAAVFAASWELGTDVGVGINLGVGRPADEGRRFTTLWTSVSLGVGLTEATSIFVEVYGLNREENRGPSTATFQAGLVYLVNPDCQLDVRAARRLTDQGFDFLLGAGLSYRLGG